MPTEPARKVAIFIRRQRFNCGLDFLDAHCRIAARSASFLLNEGELPDKVLWCPNVP